ncbi:MAG TPA: endonuclease, partial [Ferruginibacter sp.]|nr:endonuclease [Ferruginibacter sp.]
MNKKFTLLFLFSVILFSARSQVVISQYYEGAGINKWIEITNMGSTSINLASPQLRLGLWAVSGSAGNIAFVGPPSNTMDLTGTIAPGQSFLIGNTGNTTEIPYLTAASANQTSNTVINFSGNDGVALLDGSNNFIDQFGTGINAADISYVRNTSITAPSAVYAGSEWNMVARATVQAAASTDPNYLSFHITSSIPPCAEPANQPTNLVLIPTPTTIDVSFAASVPAVDEYMVVRSLSATLSASPVDGTEYTVNAAFGGGTVVSIGTSTSFVNSGLSPSTLYYYFVFAINSEACTGGPNYFNLTPLTGSTTTLALPPCTMPSAPPTNLSLNPGNISVNGSFTAATGTNRYLVVRSSGSTLSASPVDGITYSAGQAFGGGTVVTYTSSTSFTALGLTPGTVYYFFVFSANGDCNGEPFYNTLSLNGSTTTLTGNGIPPGYYDAANGLNCEFLKTSLFNIISANYNQLSYTPGVWNAYETTDMRRNDGNTGDIIWDMYSDNPSGAEPYTYDFSTDQCGSYNSEADCYNREHSFPKSWFNDASPMYSDLNHVFP